MKPYRFLLRVEGMGGKETAKALKEPFHELKDTRFGGVIIC